MSLEPGYGETPLPFDELNALLPEARAAIEEPITRAAVYDLEQAIEALVAERLITEVLSGNLPLAAILTDHFLRELHRELYGDVWAWGGQYRRYIYNIGIDWEKIPEEVRNAIGTIHYRWEHTNDWTPKEFGIAVHAELVRIHPFSDGNGRTTRLLADLVFLAAQDTETVELYDWKVEKSQYIELLRAYDQHRNPVDLAAFIPTYKFE